MIMQIIALLIFASIAILIAKYIFKIWLGFAMLKIIIILGLIALFLFLAIIGAVIQ